ncbi:AAA family ATPase [Burkholderia vietnamiensis]|uniref:AAA family ATPase n=1 Tax=Burkholderia vietnamiensis TaxID=60552 RepID=UPI00075C65E4|nr:AAA family ATPase [Burkholderia vietnamiensis]KVR95823.1 helicase DnaB [Burkholderia vietnamiensis]
MERLGKFVPKAALDIKTQTILEDMRAFLAESDVSEVSIDPFFVWFCMRHPSLNAEQQGLYKALLTRVLTESVDPETERGILPRLLDAEYANKVADVLQRFNDGAEIDLAASIRSLSEAHEKDVGKKVKIPEVSEGIESILQDDKDDRGLRWRLDCLNAVMRPLRGGDFIVLAARPDKGKTTTIASEITYMASQFNAYYGVDHGRSVLWMNNEGPGRRIVQRVYQSALNATVTDLIKMSNDGTLADEYAAAVDGTPIRVMDIHGFWNYDVEDILKRVKPGLVVFDMVDNIRFGGEAANGGQRTDQLLESMYQWARILGVKYDCPTIATSQISGDGDGLQYPTQPMLKDSKTGKQGAADVIITLGAVNDPFYASSRFIGVTKSKLRRQGAPQSPQAEVLFDGERGRLLMPQEEK